MYIAFIILIGSFCTDSHSCGVGGMCNFDDEDYGVCESCSGKNIEAACESFNTEKGKHECKLVCVRELMFFNYLL